MGFEAWDDLESLKNNILDVHDAHLSLDPAMPIIFISINNANNYNCTSGTSGNHCTTEHIFPQQSEYNANNDNLVSLLHAPLCSANNDNSDWEQQSPPLELLATTAYLISPFINKIKGNSS